MTGVLVSNTVVLAEHPLNVLQSGEFAITSALKPCKTFPVEVLDTRMLGSNQKLLIA